MEVLQAIFHYLNYWTTTLIYWFYSLLELMFDHYRITAGIIVGLFVIFKIFFDN